MKQKNQIPIYIVMIIIGMVIQTFFSITPIKTIQVNIPNKLKVNFYNENNQTIAYTSEFNIYFVMYGGVAKNKSITRNFVTHLYDPLFLSYLTDIWLNEVNATDLILHSEMYLNNRIFKSVLNVDYWYKFSMKAFDLSIINDTHHFQHLDFGNIIFMTIYSSKSLIIDIIEVNCFPVQDTDRYFPIIKLMNNNIIYSVISAWNNTINPNEWLI
jgi:hypothetical protein